MTGALVILAAMVVIGFLLFITDKTYFRHHHSSVHDGPVKEADGEKDGMANGKVSDTPEICCGQHLICEKTSLAIVSDEIIYYDDEELDRFAGRNPNSYSSEETDEFRDVLLTLLPQDVAGWAKSITLRKIELPSDVKDELYMLVEEQRANL